MLRIIAGVVVGVLLAVAGFALADDQPTVESRIAALESRTAKYVGYIGQLETRIDALEAAAEHNHDPEFDTITVSGGDTNGTAHIHVAEPLPEGWYTISVTGASSTLILTHNGYGDTYNTQFEGDGVRTIKAVDGYHNVINADPADKKIAASHELYVQVRSDRPWTITITAADPPSD